MALLSFLGDESLEEEATESDPLLTTIATRCKHGKGSFVSVIMGYGNESHVDTGRVKIVNVVFKNLLSCDWKFLVYRLDNINTNPYMVWQSFNSPVFPSEYERSKIREAEVTPENNVICD
ncbi:hypothetical protein NQ314_020214 [Rhamnusium bicolor]|uniref:Glycosyl hydrolases family 39 N-terminal catalytic domain-containing protein n=1 Tax=Rhamnusium bicolor TaxID=1586634 RepID=A0AAV8WLW1_9CUCU|nr:hypothetical protein NQ314_020214 [Rhamnusium bicolor]